LSSEQSQDRPERADRRRNREVIVAAAREVFSRADAAGDAVSMNQVARAADVGIATLYRHFPSRDELAAAVYLSKLDEVTARAREHAQGQDALGSIRIWVAEFASFMLATRGMMDTLRAAWQSATPFTSTATARIAEIVDAFLAVGATDHSVRAGLGGMDVTVAILALLSTTSPDDPGTRARRLLNLFIDGLAAQAKRTDDNGPPRLAAAALVPEVGWSGKVAMPLVCLITLIDVVT
jgi:AcrR family transcriptional regulator